MRDIKTSENFTAKDFCASKNEQFLPDMYRLAIDNLPKLRELSWHLELIRARFKSDVVITSGVRPTGLNTLIGGALNSQHLRAEAVDFVMTGIDLKDVFAWIVTKSGLKYGQVIYENHAGSIWIHYSLGEPYREKARCGQALTYVNGKYQIFVA